jgi:hypothetical protein
MLKLFSVFALGFVERSSVRVVVIDVAIVLKLVLSSAGDNPA